MLKYLRSNIKNKQRVISRIFLLCLLQLLIGGIIVTVTVALQTRAFVSGISQRVQEDIHYSHGQWDTSAYDADPEISGNYRLYVITKDGFVIDRWRPISSYLNTSDLRYLLAYQQPTTIKAATGQSWRILTKPVLDKKGDVIGGITVGSYNVTNQNDADLDATLNKSVQKLMGAVRNANGTLDVSTINVRQIPVGISFQIVDAGNTIKLKSDSASSIDHLPNYIDPSYITAELGPPAFRLLNDSVSGEVFISHSSPLFDQEHNVVGTVIVARTISPNLLVLLSYFIFGSIGALFLTVVGVWLVGRKQSTQMQDESSQLVEVNKKLAAEDITSIRFLKKESLIEINGTHCIPITFATNQYYMCIALFMAPKRKWAVDELLEKFGEDNSRENWRKAYDAMVSINKKTSHIMSEKLITTTNKTYQFNTVLTNKIKK